MGERLRTGVDGRYAADRLAEQLASQTASSVSSPSPTNSSVARSTK